jgi:hypothetical protein
MASRKAGTVSQRASYPRLILALLFCSDWIWFAFFCEGERRAIFCVGVAEGVAEEVGEVDDETRLRLDDNEFDVCFDFECDDDDDAVEEEEADDGCDACRGDKGDRFVAFPR